MKYSKKIYIIGIILIAIILGGVAYLNLRVKTNNTQKESERIAILESDTRLSSALADLKKIKAENIIPNEEVLYYNRLGLAWKSVAEITRDNQDFMLAAEAYKKAVEYSQGTNIVPIINVGTMYELTGDYAQAEKYYLQAQAVNYVEFEPHKRLVDLYTYKINKNPEEVVAMLDKAIESAVDKMPLVQLKAIYLKEKGRYQESLEVYETMVKSMPQVQSIIDELKKKINAQ